MSLGLADGSTIDADPTYTETKDAKDGSRRFVSTDQTMTIVARPNAGATIFALAISRTGQPDLNISCNAAELKEVVREYVTHHSLQKLIALHS